LSWCCTRKPVAYLMVRNLKSSVVLRLASAVCDVQFKLLLVCCLSFAPGSRWPNS
jgi:hypothetical protein